MRTERFQATGILDSHISTRSGSVRVETHDGSDIVVELDCADQELVDRVEVEHRSGADGDRLTVRAPREARWWRAMLRDHDLEIVVRVPAAGIMRVESAAADVSLAGSYRKMTVTTASGDVRFADCAGDAVITTASGDIDLNQLEGNASIRSASGSVTADAITGEAEIKSASGDIGIDRVGGMVSAMSASGSVSVGAPAGCKASTASGDLTVRDVQSGDVEARTASGDVTVSVVPGVAVQVDATSHSGSLNSEIDLSASDSVLPATSGRPVRLSLRTMSGDVVIRRSREAVAV